MVFTNWYQQKLIDAYSEYNTLCRERAIRLQWVALVLMVATIAQGAYSAALGHWPLAAIALPALISMAGGVRALGLRNAAWASRLIILIPGVIYMALVIVLPGGTQPQVAGLARAIAVPFLILTSIFADQLADLIAAYAAVLVTLACTTTYSAVTGDSATAAFAGVPGVEMAAMFLAAGLWITRGRIMSAADREHRLYQHLMTAKQAQEVSTLARLSYIGTVVQELWTPTHQLEALAQKLPAENPQLSSDLHAVHAQLVSGMRCVPPSQDLDQLRDNALADRTDLRALCNAHADGLVETDDSVPAFIYSNRETLRSLLKYVRLHAGPHSKLGITTRPARTPEFMIVAMTFHGYAEFDALQMSALARRLGGAFRKGNDGEAIVDFPAATGAFTF